MATTRNARVARTATPTPSETLGVAIKKPVVAPERRTRSAAKSITGEAHPVVPYQASGEHRESPAKKRKRLSKAFSRPLDKILTKKQTLVRERFTFPKVEYEQIAVLKKRLSEHGIAVKKSELVRAGLMLVSALHDEDLKAAIARIPSIG